MTPPLITLEEHWYSEAVFNSFGNTFHTGIKEYPGLLNKLFDAGEARLNDMDNGKVSLQVISHCVADDPSPEVCQAGNDQLANKISKHGGDAARFSALSILPMAHPEAAAAELERTVKDLGFVGALVDHKTQKGFCDGPEYDILWRTAQELDVPIYLHPSWPTEKLLRDSYAGNYPQTATAALGSSMWGWHSEVGLHILRLYAAGIFDKFPRLKIIIGHFGEMIPFMLQRITKQDARMGRERPFQQVWDQNIWITTSGAWSLDPMRCILANTKIDHILYSVDYPFTSNETGLAWIEELERSGLVTTEQLDMIAYKNAEALLKVKAPRRQ
ncbi:putative 2,3-dihydroxybenzoic acid decarboxylase [Xylariales sp. PMI_506]|nr:putative 2,3-dihydroxybenzoic acid decarboxylase [Xylariales sp. PMI_506]